MKKLLLVLAFEVVSVGSALAQLQGGNIAGVIRDEQGGALPGVVVTVQGADLTRTFTTDPEGQYRFLDLPPGRYKLTAVLQGFRTLIRDDVVVVIGQNVDLPITHVRGRRLRDDHRHRSVADCRHESHGDLHQLHPGRTCKDS